MTVKIYTTSSCTWCAREKEWLKEHDVEFTEVNVGEDRKAAEEMIEKSGQMGVPVTEVNGEIIVGFDEGRLKKALQIE